MSDNPQATDLYSRGYQDGVAAASDKIAAFFQAQKEKHAASIAMMREASAIVEGLMLNALAPLQEEVRRLKPENSR